MTVLTTLQINDELLPPRTVEPQETASAVPSAAGVVRQPLRQPQRHFQAVVELLLHRRR
jgi:hypothetical protein